MRGTALAILLWLYWLYWLSLIQKWCHRVAAVCTPYVGVTISCRIHVAVFLAVLCVPLTADLPTCLLPAHLLFSCMSTLCRPEDYQSLTKGYIDQQLLALVAHLLYYPNPKTTRSASSPTEQLSSRRESRTSDHRRQQRQQH